MAITYRIDPDRGVVFTTATGILTDDELIEHKRRLVRDPAFTAGMVELSDVRGVERLDVTPTGVGRFVAQDEADGDSLADFKLAIIAPQDVVFGMGRMYEARTDRNPLRVRIFREVTEARAWLGLPPES